MNITVYLGASEGNRPYLKTAAAELGSLIGKSGNTLVYGGSKTGLMGILADSVLRAGGKVIGVETEAFMALDYQHNGLTELIVAKNMSERKAKMTELGEAFIAFPGGIGTLEEISEVMSKCSLNEISAPCIFYDLEGYYGNMKSLLAQMIDFELSTPEKQKHIFFAENLDSIADILGI